MLFFRPKRWRFECSKLEGLSRLPLIGTAGFENASFPRVLNGGAIQWRASVHLMRTSNILIGYPFCERDKCDFSVTFRFTGVPKIWVTIVPNTSELHCYDSMWKQHGTNINIECRTKNGKVSIWYSFVCTSSTDQQKTISCISANWFYRFLVSCTGSWHSSESFGHRRSFKISL